MGEISRHKLSQLTACYFPPFRRDPTLIELNSQQLLTAVRIFIEVVLEVFFRLDSLPKRFRDHEVRRPEHEQRQHQQNHIQKYIEDLFIFYRLIWPQLTTLLVTCFHVRGREIRSLVGNCREAQSFRSP